MSMTKYNRTATINWGINTDGFEYKKLSDLQENKVYQIWGLFVTKDNGYGEGAVLILENCYVNIPARYVDDIKLARADAAEVKNIQDGNVGFHYSRFMSRFGKEGYAVTWDDLNQGRSLSWKEKTRSYPEYLSSFWQSC